MYCKNCGKEINDDVIFCSYCATKILNNIDTDFHEMPDIDPNFRRPVKKQKKYK